MPWAKTRACCSSETGMVSVYRPSRSRRSKRGVLRHDTSQMTTLSHIIGKNTVNDLPNTALYPSHARFHLCLLQIKAFAESLPFQLTKIPFDSGRGIVASAYYFFSLDPIRSRLFRARLARQNPIDVQISCTAAPPFCFEEKSACVRQKMGGWLTQRNNPAMLCMLVCD
jgi:hypothetical protein